MMMIIINTYIYIYIYIYTHTKQAAGPSCLQRAPPRPRRGRACGQLAFVFGRKLGISLSNQTPFLHISQNLSKSISSFRN